MPKAAKSTPEFRADPEQLKLLPAVSGNTINGLGEAAPRRPSPIYWFDPETIPHGALQRFYYSQNTSPEAVAARDKTFAIVGRKLPALAAKRHERSAEEWTAEIKQRASAAGAAQVAITPLRQDWVFEHLQLDFQNLIVLAIPMAYEPLSQAPSIATSVEVMSGYGIGAAAAQEVAGWLRSQGWDAYAHGGPDAGSVQLIPHAVAAGLGELGKHGSMINRELGSLFRLACVATDVPLEMDQPAAFGGDDFCTHCQVCQSACPPAAIAHAKQLVRGESKWYVDFDKCVLYFNENLSCAICLAVCPWSRPGVAPKLAAKMARRLSGRDPVRNAG